MVGFVVGYCFYMNKLMNCEEFGILLRTSYPNFETAEWEIQSKDQLWYSLTNQANLQSTDPLPELFHIELESLFSSPTLGESSEGLP